MPTFLEPFRIKMVEPIPFLTAQERRDVLSAAGYNFFNIAAEHVTVDLMTDSGTGAMSTEQWAAMMRGDESYAGARSFHRFQRVVADLSGFEHIMPVHQGRAAERILFGTLLKPGQITVSNGHFDTTMANVEIAGGRPVDLPGPEDGDEAPFKGNLDLAALRALLAGPEGSSVAVVIMTITNNAGGGQPVSLAHLREVRAVCDEYGVPLFLDASRFAENAYLVTRREPGCADLTPRQVAEQAFRLADGFWASLKKDAIANIGGVLAMRDSGLAAGCRELLIATEGFPTYGGLAGRDLEAIAQGLLEVTDPAYLAYRAQSAEWFAAQLAAVGFPVLRPTGCHAVYVDAARLLPSLTPQQLPAWALACELYLQAGVRGTELGTVAFGRPDPAGGPDHPAPRELLRLALPRRVYTRSHLEYVAEAAGEVVARADQIPGYRIVSSPPRLRHFSATFAPLLP